MHRSKGDSYSPTSSGVGGTASILCYDDPFEPNRRRREGSSSKKTEGRPLPSLMLFLVTQQFSLLIPDLQAVPINYIVIWTQRFGGFERQFERLKRLHGMATARRDAKRSV
jgi:hypothetical protein